MTVVIVAGFAGSGKTETARLMASHLRWTLLDKDTLTEPFSNALNTQLTGNPYDRSSSIYLEKVRPLEYEILNNALMENITLGNSTIVTAPYLKELTSPTWLDDLKIRLSVMDETVLLIWVDCHPDIMRTRLEQRASKRDESKLADWGNYASLLDASTHYEQADFIINNSTQSKGLLQETVINIAEYILTIDDSM